MKAKIIKNKFFIKKGRTSLLIKSFDVNHGLINATGYVIEKIAYLSDCNDIPKKSLKLSKKLNYLIVDCLKIEKHPSHFNL